MGGVGPATFTSGGEQSQHYAAGAYSRLKYRDRKSVV